ncbi:MAG: M43 family zinc metalloprotease [Bacteroidota bacterium]
MKKALLFTFFVVFTAGVFAQVTNDNTLVPKRKCGTMENLQMMREQDPTLIDREIAYEKMIQQLIEANKENAVIENGKVIVTIPTVVHVLGSSVSTSITDSRVQEQIDVLNQDYAGLSTHSMELFSSSLKIDTEIRYCLAKRTPANASTNGIERRTTGVPTSFSYGTTMKYTSSGGLDSWDYTKYMNIWVCNLSGGLCGFAEFPSTFGATYGVVIHYQYFGKTGAYAPYNLGGTTSHEIGHCFNLRHIWGDESACSGTDYCTDTPNQASENYGNHSGLVTDACTTTSPGIMYMNFMDYSDDIDYANFTPNQKTRMWASLNSTLASLKTSNGCTPLTGMDEIDITGFVSVYPNPTQGNITVQMLNGSDNISIKVYDIVGKEIQGIKITRSSFQVYNVDLSLQKAGIYFLSINDGNGTTTKKISLIN